MTTYSGNGTGNIGPEADQLLPPALLQELRRALGSMRYGSIELVVHEGRVVQLERREKVRMDIGVRSRNG